MEKNGLKYVDVWRVGIQDKKNWKIWHWSNEFNSAEAAMEVMAQWIPTHPGYSIRFIKETRFVNE